MFTFDVDIHMFRGNPARDRRVVFSGAIELPFVPAVGQEVGWSVQDHRRDDWLAFEVEHCTWWMNTRRFNLMARVDELPKSIFPEYVELFRQVGFRLSVSTIKSVPADPGPDTRPAVKFAPARVRKD